MPGLFIIISHTYCAGCHLTDLLRRVSPMWNTAWGRSQGLSCELRWYGSHPTDDLLFACLASCVHVIKPERYLIKHWHQKSRTLLWLWLNCTLPFSWMSSFTGHYVVLSYHTLLAWSRELEEKIFWNQRIWKTTEKVYCHEDAWGYQLHFSRFVTGNMSFFYFCTISSGLCTISEPCGFNLFCLQASKVYTFYV